MYGLVYLEKTAVKISDLENGWRKINKGRLVRKDLGSVRDEVGDIFPNRKMGPATMPKKPVDGVDRGNIDGKFFLQGDTGKHLENLGMKAIRSKSKTNRAAERRGLNATMNMHEGDEMKAFGTGKKQTKIAAGAGHHSYAKILGRESNRAVKAEDKETKLGTKAMTRLRTASGEKDIFNALALKDSKGKQRFKYGRDRLNRSHIKALERKEKKMEIEDVIRELQNK